MGQMRFYAPTPKKLLPHAVELAYVAGLEAIPWYSRNSLADDVLTIDRVVSESGNLYIPWSIPGIGDRVLSTCTLMERDAPYCLATELAHCDIKRNARACRGFFKDHRQHGIRNIWRLQLFGRTLAGLFQSVGSIDDRAKIARSELIDIYEMPRALLCARFDVYSFLHGNYPLDLEFANSPKSKTSDTLHLGEGS